ncbi:low molecular weight protein-tyrosine-phosphatase [Alteromonas lipotrueiana]|uniref:low molecular weight protein-tyrosine-phosphatase n=1 Tax=Alteromonas lipotrueiana TaxID=2803815 RepID=UPI001C44D10C|nr:low molecular weight protein-tyrosine-phosphatase [Alteromonas lipotrueiana]
MSQSQSAPTVLFVCLGNICRSPTAEAVFRHKARASGINVTIDSAGTHGYHIGNPPDKRSQQAGVAKGYDFAGLACRKVAVDDFEKYDYILAMDNRNLEHLKKISDEKYHHKIHLFLSFAKSDYSEVPDPYYGGRRGFELVLDLIEQASEGLINRLRAQQ